MAKPAYYWAKMAIFGQNILFFLGGSTFGINISETPKAPGWHWFLGRAWHNMDQKGQYLAKKVNFWPKLAVLNPKS